MKTQIKKPLYKITEYKNGCVFKTKLIGEYWVDDVENKSQENEIAKSLGGDFFSPPSYKTNKYDDYYRTVKDDHSIEHV